MQRSIVGICDTVMTIVESHRLLFRHHCIDDLEPHCAMEMDADVRRYVGSKPRSKENAERRFREQFLPEPSGRMALWATVFKPENAYIGYCGVCEHHAENAPVPFEGKLAFYLARPYWGRGLATEAGQAFIDFAFTELKLHRLIAGVEVGHAASIRVLEKLNFRRFKTDLGPRSFHAYELVLPTPRPPSPLGK